MGTRLQGTKYLKTETTAAEVTTAAFVYDSNIGAAGYNSSYGLYAWKRAPSAFDVVCYTGNDTIRTLNHNLTVAPELIIVKGRNTTPANTNGWTVYAAPLGNTKYLYLNQTNASATFTGYWNDTTPTASVFT